MIEPGWLGLVVDPPMGAWRQRDDVDARTLVKIRLDVTPAQLRSLGLPDLAAMVEAAVIVKDGSPTQPAGAAAASTGIPAGGQFRSGGPPAGLPLENELYFPILGPTWAPRGIPWRIVEPHRRQAMVNCRRTLEEIAERGGLDPIELVAVLEDRPARWMGQVEAVDRLNELLRPQPRYEGLCCSICGATNVSPCDHQGARP